MRLDLITMNNTEGREAPEGRERQIIPLPALHALRVYETQLS
jgi:hypothetical protein